jgi:hypothetical protein
MLDLPCETEAYAVVFRTGSDDHGVDLRGK